MKIKTIGILMGVALCFATPVGYAEDDVYSDYAAEEYEDYEVFDDVEDLIDEELTDNPDDTAESETAAADVPAPRAVADRMTCVDIETRIAELRADVKAYPELRADLEYMLTRQRNQCAPRATRRPVHNYKNVNPIVDIEAPAPEVEEVAPAPVVAKKTSQEVAAEPAVSEEDRQAQIAENFAKGLCGDGSKPNKYGCCEGEVFKQIEHLNFACCPKDGDGECRAPFRK